MGKFGNVNKNYEAVEKRRFLVRNTSTLGAAVHGGAGFFAAVNDVDLRAERVAGTGVGVGEERVSKAEVTELDGGPRTACGKLRRVEVGDGLWAEIA